MKAMIGGNIVNLVPDPVLMFGFDMGIAGGDREDTRIWLQVRAGASGSTAIVFGQ